MRVRSTLTVCAERRGVEVPVEDAIRVLDRRLPANRLMCDCVHDPLVHRAISHFNQLMVLLHLQGRVDEESVRRLEGKLRRLIRG